jgi:hypothetical protein
LTSQGVSEQLERTMLDRLNARYGSFQRGNGFRYARAEHVKLTAGFDTRRICDYMAMDLWPGGYGPDAGPKLHGHEVKVSRSDWLAELREPEKAEAFARFCDFWWLVVSDKSIVRDDLPEGWGLMVASGDTLRAVVKPTRRTPVPLERHQQATFARAVTKTTLRLAGTDPALAHTAQRMHLGGTA